MSGATRLLPSGPARVIVSTEMVVATLGSRLRTVAGAALDVVLPPRCAACDAPVDAPGQLCGRCFGQAVLLGEPCCAHCGTPVNPDWSGLACLDCATRPPPWRRARAGLRYDALARRLILPLKYADRPDLARALALHMARAGAALLHEADLLVPVPLHRRRLYTRRYNQAALLARACGRLAGRPVLVDALRRVRATQPLHEKGPDARRAELSGAIEVNTRRCAQIRGARVILVDDVLTSGATAAACTEAMLAAGVAHVDLLVAARTVRHEPGGDK